MGRIGHALHAGIAALLLASTTAASAPAHASAGDGHDAPLEASFDWFEYEGSDPADARYAPGPGQFRNPVLKGFYPDPSVVRVGADYYLVNSTFGWFPGIPVFHSRDLVNWTQIGNAIDRADQLDFGRHDLVNGVFAPAIEYHDGLFYITNTCFPACGGNFVLTARDPAGPWSDPAWLPDLAGGIDPSLFFDDDGRAWIVNNDLPEGGKERYPGHRAIWLQEFDAKALRTIGPRRVLLDGGVVPAQKPEYVEGPHLFKKDGWYYLTAAEGGTGEQHAQMVWRSRQVTGPYEPWPGNPSLTQRDLDPNRPQPVTSAGHAQFIKLKDGSWWAVFLATRPYRGNENNLGRETFLLPVTWHDGWPMILPRGERIPVVLQRPDLPSDPQPVPTTGPFAWREHFTAGQLPPQWMTIHPPKQPWFKTGADGLRITPSTTSLGGHGSGGQPAYLAHRLQHHHATITATLDPNSIDNGDLAGLALIQNERHHYVVAIENGQQGAAVVVLQRTGEHSPVAGQELKRIALSPVNQPVSLRFELEGPRLNVYYATDPGHWQAIATNLDASLLSAAIAGGFIGNTFGPYALRR